MEALLYIPWFQATPWEIPIPGLGTLPIQPFGVLVAIGVLLGAKIAEVWGKKNGIAPSVVSDLVGHIIVAGFVGAFFLNAVFYEPEKVIAIFEDPALLKENYYLGLSSFGGFAGAIAGGVIWRIRRGMSLVAVAEAACFAFPFGWVFGRLGCFVAKDHPGRITEFFLAVDSYQVRGALPPYPPRHDLGLYEAFWSLAAASLFAWLARKRRARGFYMALLPLLYAPVRFLLDYLRAEPTQGGDVRYFGLTPGQYGSLVLLGIGLFVWWRIQTKEEPSIPGDAAWPPPLEEPDVVEPDQAPDDPKSADTVADSPPPPAP